MTLFWILVSIAVALFAVFPLTDTDIWWHLACARERVTTWTPVREPVVNVHDFFQQILAFVYNVGGAPLLVAFKAVLWGCVFALFFLPFLKKSLYSCYSQRNRDLFEGECHHGLVPGTAVALVLLLFVFRFHFEIRPVLFSLLFLGIYWNVLPWLFNGNAQLTGLLGQVSDKNHCHDSRLKCHSGTERKCSDRIHNVKLIVALLFLLTLQWIWCKCQGLYILGPILATIFCGMRLLEILKQKKKICTKVVTLQVLFVILLFAMPFLHRDGLNLFLYPFGLLDRLLGLSPSAAIFASEIAENRSPLTLLMTGENVLESALMIVLCLVGIFGAVRYMILTRLQGEIGARALWHLITAILALTAERNFVLFLPVFIATFASCHSAIFSRLSSLYFRFAQVPNARLGNGPTSGPAPLVLRICRLSSVLLIAFLLGFWIKSLMAYDSSMIAYQRVPVAATEWTKNHPHSGKLFNDDRAGGYLAFVNPSDSTYIDGRFILKTADFFERYLEYSKSPQLFLHDADSLNIDRAVLPLRYYARWNKLIFTLDSIENWQIAHRDSFFVVLDRLEPATKNF